MTDIAHLNCTVDSDSRCGTCRIKGKLECKWNKGALHGFLAIALPASLIGLIAIAFSAYVTSSWWYLIAPAPSCGATIPNR